MGEAVGRLPRNQTKLGCFCLILRMRVVCGGVCGEASSESDRNGLILSDSGDESGLEEGVWEGLPRNRTKLGGFCLILGMGAVWWRGLRGGFLGIGQKWVDFV